jgi:hypothetical protein
MLISVGPTQLGKHAMGASYLLHPLDGEGFEGGCMCGDDSARGRWAVGGPGPNFPPSR